MIAAIAVLCLAALATFVAVVPSSEPEVDPEQRLKAMALEFSVSGRKIETDVNGRPVLSGMVVDNSVRQRMQQMIVDEGLDAGLMLTTGADLASDVARCCAVVAIPATPVIWAGVRWRSPVTTRMKPPSMRLSIPMPCATPACAGSH